MSSIIDSAGDIAKRLQEIKSEEAKGADAAASGTVVSNGSWMSIDSAPKDGSHISLFNNNDSTTCTGRWSLALTAWMDNDAGLIFYPTHWRPL